jgi:hypothetical protein
MTEGFSIGWFDANDCLSSWINPTEFYCSLAGRFLVGFDELQECQHGGLFIRKRLYTDEDNPMDVPGYIQSAVSVCGLLGGLFAYIFGLRIKDEILENNKLLERQIIDLKDKFRDDIIMVREHLIRELGSAILKQADKNERSDRAVSEMAAGLNDKILTVVNGKYVRSDLFNQTVVGFQDRFASMKDLIHLHMEKLQQGLDQQILDLKERIFHGK